MPDERQPKGRGEKSVRNAGTGRRRQTSATKDDGGTRARDVLSQVQERLGQAAVERTDPAVSIPSVAELLADPRPRLLAYAKSVGLTGVQRLTKAALASRIRQELERLAGPVSAEQPADASHKFDLGSTPAAVAERQDIPWGYGQDRLTAMAVDPAKLYVYWEVTDEALGRARAGLGPGGSDAWLCLRVYDVSNRIFDGTNAHQYFDHAVSRTDRQWFFSIGRPSSTVVVEIGLKSNEGYFVRVARSGRADFPRQEPVPTRRVEWLTVRSASGAVGEPAIDHVRPAAFMAGGVGPTVPPEPARAWDIRRIHGGGNGGRVVREESVGTAWREWGGWVHERTSEWEGPIVRTSWEAGPFSLPVEPPRYMEEHYDGSVTVHSVEGMTHIVHGPWQVVIRGVGARAERKVLAVWEVRHSWVTDTGVAVRGLGGTANVHGGSEQVMLGASELLWRAGSELRLGGASELYLLGASELRYLGATERFFVGASEWRARGASEQRYLGASEWRERGASESRYAGASERLYPGASEQAWPGASENRPRYPGAPSSER